MPKRLPSRKPMEAIDDPQEKLLNVQLIIRRDSMNWKISKKLVTVFMAFMLVLEIPVYAFAEDVPAENAPVEDVQDNTEYFANEPFVEGTGDVQEVQVFEEAGKTQEPEASENPEASVNFETPAAQTVPEQLMVHKLWIPIARAMRMCLK